MKKYILAFVLVLSTLFSFAQKPMAKKNIGIRVKYESESGLQADRLSGMKFQTYLRGWANKHYTNGGLGLIQLTTSVEASNEKMIEGMETVTIADVTLKVKLLNKITGEEKVWDKVVKGRGTNLAILKRKAIAKFNDSKENEELHQFLDDYLENEFIKNCQKYYNLATKKYDEGQFIKALQILSYIRKDTPCGEQAKSLMSEAYLMEQKKNCNTYIYRATIAYESGDYGQSLKNLYKVSPRSACADEAMQVAKNIGKKFENKDSFSKGTVNLYQFIIEHQDPVKQVEWDEKIMLDLMSQEF